MRTITITMGDQLSVEDMDTVELAIAEAINEFPVGAVTVDVDRDDKYAVELNPVTGWPVAIARVEYLVETDEDATWHDVAVYNEAALTTVTAEMIKTYGKDHVNVVRYTRAPALNGR